MFLQAKLRDGTTVISEFSKLASVQKYANQVFAGVKPFNAWRVVGDTHPVSGEKVLLRTREMINGKEIVSITEVQQDGTPIITTQAGARGLWKAPLGASVEVEGVQASAGETYPKHRDPVSMREYVILRAAAEGGESEVRYYTDGDDANGGAFSRGVNDVDFDEGSEDNEDDF